MEHARSREGGFTLVEVVICAGLLAGAAASAAWLVARAVEEGERARVRTAGTIAAVQKMEQLRSLAWDGESDTSTDLAGEAPAAGGPGLVPSPPGTLDENVPPLVDYLADDGALIVSGTTASAALARRWAVHPHPQDPDILVLRVVVTRPRGPASRSAAGPGPYDVELVSFRARYQP